MLKFIGRLLDRLEARLSLWGLLGGASVSFSIPAWAAYASQWLAAYGPIGWVAAGFLGMMVFMGLAAIGVNIYTRTQAISLYRKIAARGDVVNPLETNFYRKRIHLQWFIPPSSEAVQGKIFNQCEIIGPINIIPFGCMIIKSLYVSSDYIMVSTEALSEGKILNARTFRDCHFTECKFYFVSFLVNELAFEAFDRTGGCNWITKVPIRQPDLLAPPNLP